jgi:NADH-quinone oxidoreductase subunit N
MNLDLTIPADLTRALTPDLVVIVGAMVLLLVAVWGPETPEHDRRVGWLALLVCVLSAAAVFMLAAQHATARTGMIAVDLFRWVVDLLILFATAVSIGLAMDDNRREGIAMGEGYVMVLFAASGMMILAAARDLMLVFLGIELMSIAVYVLAGLNRRSARAAEASLKYFLMGAFATGFLLYGIALVYGATGSTSYATIRSVLAGEVVPSPMLLVGIGLLVVGFGFKVAAVPFHMWTPDVYEGAPTAYTAFMAAAVKAAAFASLVRLWNESFLGVRASWTPVLWWLAVVTMVIGNLIALQQKNIKRMLAYSSIAHAGYLLVGVTVGSLTSMSAVFFYLVAYALATLGAFAVVISLSRPGDRGQQIEDLAGLWTVRPWTAAAMAVFMFSLLGFPIAGGMGFWGKWMLLQAALERPWDQITLAVILVLASVVSAGYYLNVVVTMYMKPRADDAPAWPALPRIAGTIMFGAAALVLWFGLQPDLFVQVATASAQIPPTLTLPRHPLVNAPTPRP